LRYGDHPLKTDQGQQLNGVFFYGDKPTRTQE